MSSAIKSATILQYIEQAVSVLYEAARSLKDMFLPSKQLLPAKVQMRVVSRKPVHKVRCIGTDKLKVIDRCFVER